MKAWDAFGELIHLTLSENYINELRWEEAGEKERADKRGINARTDCASRG